MLRSKYEEMRISEAMKVSGIYVVDEAIVPTVPVKTKKTLNTAIAGILGLFVGVGIAFILSKWIRRSRPLKKWNELYLLRY